MVNSLRKTLIFVICGAIFVAFLVLLIILRHVLMDDYRGSVEINDKKFAQVLSQNVNYDIGRAVEIGQLAAEYPALMNFNRATQESLIKNMNSREPSYEYVALLDKNDRPVVVSNSDFSDVDKTSYEWFKVFRPNYEAEISPAYFSEKTQNLVVTFVEGVVDGGEVKGAVMGDINLTSLQEMIRDFNEGSMCQAYLIDKSGTAIANPADDGKIYNYRSMNYLTVAINDEGHPEYDENGHLKLRRASFFAPRGLYEAIFAAMKGESGTSEYTDDKGNGYFCCYQPIDLPVVKTKWSLVIVHPTIEVLAALDGVLNKAFVGGMILVILVGFTMYYFANKITRPIMEMAAMANRVRNGDLSGQLTVSIGNEIGELANNINHMIQGLRTTREKSKEAESRFKAIAYHDALTGLPNRNHFLIHLRKIIENSIRNRFYGALLFVDADKFKSINDTYGHAVGDGLLIEFGKRIVDVVGNKDSVCRYGGDEFLLFLLGYDETDARAIAGALVRKMREPFNISGHEFNLSASVGVALMPKDATNVDDLMEKADAALYVSKRNGRDQFNFYEIGMVTAPKSLGNDF